ncbi:HlyD family secretion protein [Gemmatimonas groenlandica]|uniref:RND efflux pump membrane fusion protein barrel-sandwich domain-containing protein n=1 Tax=Gemmatimonas groenlandica TaxID=2732249 RepID=A0A6M4J075_9BACT|nr:hypothetical protein [Gemmatimonas groenlandica]QJR37861.1 hypothetical protein HKW67_21205 [Gemmatimonas groenlandica]
MTDMTRARDTRRQISIARTVCAAILLVSMAACGLHDRPKVERRSADNVRNAPPLATTAGGLSTDSNSAAPVVAPGVVEPWDAQVELAAQEPGWIDSILVREGEEIRAGQLLAVLADAAQRHGVDAARADLAEAEAVRAKQARGATAEELQQGEADRLAARSRAVFAKSNAARLGKLRATSGTSVNEIERVEAEAAAQGALAEHADARLQELRRGARREDRDAAAARVDAARARLAMATSALARRRVHAPRAGTVLLSRFHAGEYYDPHVAPLFALGDLTRLQVRLELDEIDGQDIRVGARTSVVSDAGAPLATGTIVRLAPRMGRRALTLESPTARADVRIREVFVDVPASPALVPGQRVWGYTPRARRVIPSSATASVGPRS